MEKTTLKFLKHLVTIGAAELIKEQDQSLARGCEQVAISSGICGANGLLIKRGGKLYAIIGRSSTLSYYL